MVSSLEIVKGSVVKARAGRDKDDFFIVVEVDSEYAMICNGKRRSVEKPKRKKLKHLYATKTVVEEKSMSTNREIRKALSRFIGAQGEMIPQ